MKICLLNDSFPPVIDGVVNVLLNYADYMRRDHGAAIIVGTPEYPGADYDAYDYPVVAYPSLDTAAVTNGYRTGNPFSEKKIFELAAFGPDIIHSHCPASSTVIGRLLREAAGAPLVMTYHTKYDIDIRRFMKIRSVADEAIRVMVSNIEACDEVWTVSRGAAESLKELGFEGDCIVMNNGVDFAKGRVSEAAVAEATKGYDLPGGIPVFLFVGRLITYKGLPLILDALEMLAGQGQDFRMVFVGSGPDREMLEKRAEAAGLKGRCIFTGPIYDREVLRAWNTRADLFLFPSTFDTNGLVVREAAACGLASVLIRNSCAAEGITDGRNGFLIYESAGSMAAFLKEACLDLPRLHDAGQHAMDEIYLSWRECAAQAYERYQQIIERKKSGLLTPRKKLPSDYLVSMTARGMQEWEHLRQKGEDWRQQFREYTQGMMDNIAEAEDAADLWAALISEKRMTQMEKYIEMLEKKIDKQKES